MFALLMLGMLGFLSACKDDDPEVENAGLYAIDREFLMQAAQSNVTEVALGNIAIQKSNDAAVKDYASMMITQHTTAQNELLSLGSTKRWTVQNQLNEANQALRDQLNALSGAEFDRAYLRSQVASHQVTAGKFATQIDQGRDTELKAYATKYKPGIDMHLQMAQQLVAGKGF